MDKRTLIINRRHCWVRKSSEMGWHRDSEHSLNYEEAEVNNPEIRRQTRENVPIEDCE